MSSKNQLSLKNTTKEKLNPSLYEKAEKKAQDSSEFLDLAEKIFQIVSEIKTIPTENSIIYLKKELQQLF